jgi:hypothetical protein
VSLAILRVLGILIHEKIWSKKSCGMVHLSGCVEVVRLKQHQLFLKEDVFKGAASHGDIPQSLAIDVYARQTLQSKKGFLSFILS